LVEDTLGARPLKTMDLDVVVCAKNRAEMLERVLQQIIRQIPFRNLIVIYATSKDGTKQVAEKYTKKVFWDGDRGLGAARNLGIRKAVSELVAMIDTDVLLTKGWYGRLLSHFEDPKAAAVMGSNIYGYGFRPLQRLSEYQLWWSSKDWGCINTIFKRDLVLEVGNFDETIRGAGEDYDLYKRILAAGYKWVWDRKVVVYHPLTLSEYLSHIAWWARGAPYIQELIDQVRTYSLLKIYCRSAFKILLSFKNGVADFLNVDPALLFLTPMFQFVTETAKLKELKKMLTS
jgi:glycosyltransferase involved in cell wall biosynthesis